LYKNPFDRNHEEVRSISGDVLKGSYQEENFIIFCKFKLGILSPTSTYAKISSTPPTKICK